MERHMDSLAPPPQTPQRNAPQTPPERPPKFTPTTPGGGFAKQKKQLGWAVPSLYIPPPQGQQYLQQQYAPPTLGVPPSAISTNPSANPYFYPTKASDYLFSQFNGIRDFTMGTAKAGLGIGEKCSFWCFNKVSSLSKRWFTHIFLTIVIVLYTLGGAAMFATIEGRNEEKLVVGDIRKERYRVIKTLQELAVTKPKLTQLGEWEGEAARLLEDFEDYLIEAFKTDQLIVANHGPKIWTFWNSMVYCSTIYTTIGYGHMYPTTTTGRALTIVYAIIGIPLFLIILTDFGKLFTRIIKYLWSYVRRLYYTGSCRRVRKTAHMEDIMKGAQYMYEVATFKKHADVEDEGNAENKQEQEEGTATTTTPAPTFEVDDEFNLPITIAIFILVLYIMIGSSIFYYFENWDFFSAFYFVFISMATIGFGDYVPTDRIGMYIAIVYLVFGLALMSMCINVVQSKLSDTFKHASAKIGATIGLSVAEDDGSVNVVPPPPVEVPKIHNESNEDEEIPRRTSESKPSRPTSLNLTINPMFEDCERPLARSC